MSGDVGLSERDFTGFGPEGGAIASAELELPAVE
jgi:hypothetical protein